MDIIVLIILAIVQGITEFLPVSSSGHLVLIEKIFNVQDGILFLNIILHVASLLAVIIYYRKTLWQLIIHPFNKTNLFLILATVPTILIVLLFNDFFENAFNGKMLVWGFLLTALILFMTEQIQKSYEKNKQYGSPITTKKATMLGIFQGLAVLPGLSRSGTTLCAGIIMGVDKKNAVNFSFLMSIPVILCSLVYELFKINFSISSINLSIFDIIFAMFITFIFAYLGIKLMIKIVEKVKYIYFSIYLILLSIFTIIML